MQPDILQRNSHVVYPPRTHSSQTALTTKLDSRANTQAAALLELLPFWGAHSRLLELRKEISLHRKKENMCLHSTKVIACSHLGKGHPPGNLTIGRKRADC